MRLVPAPEVAIVAADTAAVEEDSGEADEDHSAIEEGYIRAKEKNEDITIMFESL